MIRVLTFTSLFPNASQPRLGIFVAQRLNKLVATGEISARVVAPVPWFPVTQGPFRKFAATSTVPKREQKDGIDVVHPRFPLLPGFSTWINPLLMALASKAAISDLVRDGGDFDVIDAQFVYPDGIAGVLLAQWFDKPVLITARGTDVNVLTRPAIPRAWLRWATSRCAGFITVSAALKQSLCEQGVPESRITVLRNGIDLETFKPLMLRDAQRAKLRFSTYTLLSVGNLVEEKGHDLVIRALAKLPDCHLVIVGSGPLQQRLQNLARELSLSGRIAWLAYLTHAQLAEYYAAADVLILASSREGMANVLLESLACGTPVIASAVGGSPEVVATPEAGILLPVRTPDAISRAVVTLQQTPIDRGATRRYAESFGWQKPIIGQVKLIKAAMHAGSSPVN